MKNIRYFLFLILLLATPTAQPAALPLPQPGLSIQEQREILKTCLVPQELKQKLDNFSRRSDVSEYLAIPKRFMFPWGYNRLTPQSLQQARTYMQMMQATEKYRLQCLTKLCSNYGLNCHEGLGAGATSTIISSPNWNGYLLKILNVSYPMFSEIYDSYFPEKKQPGAVQSFQTIIATKTRYQGISRVLMARKIANFVTQEGLNLIKVPQKFLYPLPTAPVNLELTIGGVSYPEICDDNYIVIAQEIPNLPQDVNLNQALVTSMVNKGAYNYADFIKPEYADLIEQLIQVITYAGVWNVNPDNVFVVAGQFALIDLEKGGLGGFEDKFFFHKDQAEVNRNSSAGFDGLCEWLKK